MPMLQRAGQPTLHYRVDDYTDEWREAPVLILQHGYGRSSRFWYQWVPYLACQYRVVRPDIRGLGESPLDFDPATGLSVENFIGDLIAIIDAVSPGRPVHYCGESLGGILGMVLAATHPDRIRTLGLVAAPVTIPKQTQVTFSFGHPSWQEALAKLGSRGWAEAANASSRFPTGTDPGLVAWYANEMARSRVEVLIALSRLAMQVDASPYLPKIQVPTLGFYPAQGVITGPEEAQIRDTIPDCTIVNLPTPYHAIQVLYPKACAQHLLHFCARHDGVPVQD